MQTIKQQEYVVIQDFMVSELHLTGNDLLIYAIIYGFTQSTGGFFAGAQYLANWCDTSKRSVFRNLQRMVYSGIISKKDVIANGEKYCTYCTKRPAQNVTRGGDTMSSGGVTICEKGGDLMSPNKLSYKLEDNMTSSEMSLTYAHDLVFFTWGAVTKTGNCPPQMQRNFEAYRAKGCHDDLLLFALEKMQEAGSCNWAYAKKILDTALANNCKTRAQYNAFRKPWNGKGKNARIDRAEPSGNDFLKNAMNRPRKLKRND